MKFPIIEMISKWRPKCKFPTNMYVKNIQLFLFESKWRPMGQYSVIIYVQTLFVFSNEIKHFDEIFQLAPIVAIYYQHIFGKYQVCFLFYPSGAQCDNMQPTYVCTFSVFLPQEYHNSSGAQRGKSPQFYV